MRSLKVASPATGVLALLLLASSCGGGGGGGSGESASVIQSKVEKYMAAANADDPQHPVWSGRVSCTKGHAALIFPERTKAGKERQVFDCTGAREIDTAIGPMKVIEDVEGGSFTVYFHDFAGREGTFGLR